METKVPRVLLFPNGDTLSAHLITAVREIRKDSYVPVRRIAVEYMHGANGMQASAYGDDDTLDEFFSRAREHHLNPYHAAPNS